MEYMATRSTRLLMLGEQIRINRDYMNSCITRASAGFLVRQNVSQAQKYLNEIQASLNEMSRLEDSRVSQKQEKRLVEMGCCPRN